MRKKHKWLKGLLATGMAALLLAQGALAGTFQMGYVPDGSGNLTGTYYYSDSYFLQGDAVNNAHLLNLSLSLSVATSGAELIEKLMKEIGFSDIKMEEMGKGTVDTIGSVIGRKQVGENPLVLLVVRGVGYGGEWASNMLVGAEGSHTGFQSAAEKIVARLKAYIQDNGLTSPKIWITGYSRGAAVTNLVGEYINEHLEEFGTNAENLYSFAYEPPQASASTKTYSNMVSVKKKGDLVTALFPESFGLHNPGSVITVGNSFTIPQYQITDLIWKTDPSTLPKVDAETFLKEMMDVLGTNLTRQEYAAFEENISKLVSLYYSLDGEMQKKLASIFGAEFLKNLSSDSNLIGQILTVLASPNQETLLALGKIVGEIITNNFKKNAFPISDEDNGRIATLINQLLLKFGPIIVSELNAGSTSTDAVGAELSDAFAKGREDGFCDALNGQGRDLGDSSEDYAAGYAKGYELGLSFKEHLSRSAQATYDGVELPVSGEVTIGADASVGEDSKPKLTGNLATLIGNISTLIECHYPVNVFKDLNELDPYFYQYPDTPDPGQADLIIPEGVVEIGEEAFAGNAARFVVIPKTCTLVGERAFADCPNLEVIYFEDINQVTIADSYLDGSGKSDILVAAGYTS